MIKRYCCDCKYYEFDPNAPEYGEINRQHQCWHNNNLTPIDLVTGKFNFIKSPYALRYFQDDESTCGNIGRWFEEKTLNHNNKILPRSYRL
jgi:hypothetical protein